MREDDDYKWKVAVRLDNSFQFLLSTAEETANLLADNRRVFLSWLAGLVDADGSLYFTHNADYVRISLAIGMTRPDLLRSIATVMESFGYNPSGPYLAFEAGLRTPRGIVYTKDLWRIYFQRSGETQQLLAELPLRHAEKITHKELAISLRLPMKWETIEAKVLRIGERIETDRNAFIELAKNKYLVRKPRRTKAPVVTNAL